MEIQRINKGKIKITLTRAECLRYNLKEEDGEFDTSAVRDALPNVLSSSGADVDFKPGSEKLLVQLYPMDNGGAELFVTKLGVIGERERRAVEGSDALSTYSRNTAYFYFEDLCDLVLAARAAKGKHKSVEIYLSRHGGYIASMPEERLGALSSCDLFLEFATRLPANFKINLEWDKKLYEGDVLPAFARLEL